MAGSADSSINLRDGSAMSARGPREIHGANQPSTSSTDLTRKAAAIQPLITIAIPTFNRAEQLQKCLRSVMAQTYQKLEILVSDNASTDGTQEMLSAIDDDRLRVITNAENIGPTRNMNQCIAEGRGEYLVLGNDDNYYHPGFVEKCVRLIQKEPGLPIVVAGHDFLVIDEFSEGDEWLVPSRLSPKLGTGIWQSTDVLSEFLLGRFSTQLLSSAVRTDILRGTGGLPTDYLYSTDTAVLAQVLFQGRAGVVDETCVTVIVHPDCLTEKLGVTQRLSDARQVTDELASLADERISDKDKRDWIRKLLNRHVALCARSNFLAYRRNGGTLFGIIQHWREWSPFLKGCSFTDFLLTWRLRSFIRLLCPQVLVRWMVRCRVGRLYWQRADAIPDILGS